MLNDSCKLDSKPHTIRRSVVIGHPCIGHGGSEARVMWLIECLKREFNVTVVTTGDWDLQELNALYGTNIAPDEVTLRIAPVPLLARGVTAAALRGACYQRFARAIAPEYDIHVSAYNTTDWGVPAIQFIADFSWHQEVREKFDPPTPGFIYKDTFVRRIYLKISAAYGRPSGRDVLRDDIVLANSHWTASLMKQHCNVDCADVVYPPVGMEFPKVPWEKKDNAFVMIGRIAPEKRIERAIEILEAVRKCGHPIRLRLCGPIGHDLYGKEIARLCHERADWIAVEGSVSGEKKARILAQCRFGIQTRAAEPFGISVAEMVKAGAIVFAPDNGGQAEVLNSPELLFADTNDAVEKICSLITDDTKQLEMRSHLAEHAEQFTSRRFMDAAYKLVSDMSSAPRRFAIAGRRPKVVIGHPRLGGGGSESTAMWLVEALKEDFEVTVLTTGGWNLPALNLYYGTRILEGEVRTRLAPLPWPFQRYSAAAIRGACYQRFAKQVAAEYDLRISAYNMTDWGMPAIHFLADFSWNQELRTRFDPPSPGLIYRDSIIRSAYLKLAASFADPSGRDVLKDDIVVANSQWSARIMKQYCGTICDTIIHPPAGTAFPHVPWQEKEPSFVMIGRIAPEKRIESAIEILEEVRRQGYPVRLHLCGQIETDKYGKQIEEICDKRSQWILLEGSVSGSAKSEILTRCKFGIQTRAAEPFGISILEMIKAGAIVFAPQDGGQAEVLGHPDLLFSDRNDAVSKIIAILHSESMQTDTRRHLALQAQQFSPGTFVQEAHSLAKEVLDAIQPNAVSPIGRTQ